MMFDHFPDYMTIETCDGEGGAIQIHDEFGSSYWIDVDYEIVEDANGTRGIYIRPEELKRVIKEAFGTPRVKREGKLHE